VYSHVIGTTVTRLKLVTYIDETDKNLIVVKNGPVDNKN